MALLLSGCGGSGGGSTASTRQAHEPPVSSLNDAHLQVSDASDPTLGDPIPPDPHSLTTPEDFARHPGFRNQWGYAAINADRAFANFARAKGGSAAPGTGVTVGFIDTGLHLSHRAFRNRTGTSQVEYLSGATVETGMSGYSHGTAVASVVGAARDRGPRDNCNGCMHGIAWGADLHMFAIPAGSAGDRPYQPRSPEFLAGIDQGWAELVNQVLSHDIDILNLSVGYSGIIENYSAAELRANLGRFLAAMAQADDAEKTIFVWAAGNANGRRCDESTDNCIEPDDMGMGHIDATSVEILPGLVARIDELQGHTIAVVATNRDGGIASFSNRCGIAADWCIAAPGQDIRVAFFGHYEGVDAVRGWATGVNGTSVAAPMVAGSLAVMKHYFRDRLAHTELVTRLFATADRTGRYAERDIYGQGMLDLGAAVSPVGEVTVATAGTADAPDGASLDETRLRLGGAFGDALRSAHSGVEVAAFDQPDAPFCSAHAAQQIVAFDRLGAPFCYELDSLVERPGAALPPVRFDDFLAAREEAPPSSWADLAAAAMPGRAGFHLGPLTSTWRRYNSGMSFAYLAHAANAAALSWSGADSGLAATFFATPRGHGLGDDASSPGRASGATLSWRPATGGTPFGFGLHAGWLAEQDALLGSSATGAFGQWSTDTLFAGFDTSFNVGSGDARHGWRVLASAEIGVSEPTPQGGMVQDLPPLTASAFALRAERAFADGARLRFSLAQPLRIESDAGGATLSIPVDRDKSSEVTWQELTTSLTPSGRQLDASVRWDRPLAAKNTELRLGATWTRHPGHNAAAEPELLLLGGLRHSF